ncbi:MAG: glycerate kinase [Caldisphaeraceae archaeon]|nr:glycerate kinase [Caldisphaeraceae archaeon]
MDLDPKSDLYSIIKTIVTAADLSHPVANSLKKFAGKELILIAFGKGAGLMSQGAFEVLEDRIVGGVIVIPRGGKRPKVGSLEIIESGHPIPDESSIKAGDAVIEWSKQSKKNTVYLISGGGSALVEKPLDDIMLDDIKILNEVLLKSGIEISGINTIRKHLSMIKGGRLIEHSYPSKTYGFYASDVPGDKIDQIASGPTVPDPTTFEDAYRIIINNGLENAVPRRVTKVINEGMEGKIPETLKPGDKKLRRVRNKIVANNEAVLRAVSGKLKEMGYKTLILTSRLEGESREVGYMLASITLDAINKKIPKKPPLALILGGETSVTVKGSGIGGRNTELALAWAIKMQQSLGRNVSLLIFATDGIDGPTDAAGAIIGTDDLEKLKKSNINLIQELNNNNSYKVLEKINSLIKTGHTGSNLNNVIVIAIS